MAKYGKKNEVKLDILKYNIGLIGESGIGKTTIIKQLCERLAGEDGYMFLECGKEDGADAIEGINFVNCPEWSADYNEYSNSMGFEDFVDDVIENRTKDWKNLRVVVVDTYDQLLDIAKPEVIVLHNRENPDKPVKSIKAAFGGYMGGEDKATEIVLEKLWDLKTVGVSFIIIGHVKQKEQEDVVTGQKFTTLTTNMSMRDFNAIKTKLHFLGVASIDREIVQEKTGKKDNKGKDLMKGVIASESRKITFRDDSYSIDSKSRFADIVSEIPFDVDSLIKALEDAIKAEQSKSGKTIEQTKEEQAKEEAKKLKSIAKAEEDNKFKKTLEEKISVITDFIKENKSDMSVIKPILELSKELGYTKPTEITTIEDADKVISLIQQ
jgi:ABC-type oligopeptide transport system ATPase subunit